MRIGFGCVGLSTLPTATASRRLLESVLDLGITHFDTAPTYGRGYSERVLAEFLRGKRERVFVATKFGLGIRRPILSPQLALPLNYLWKRIGAKGGRRATNTFTETAKVAQALDLPTARCITRQEIETSFEHSRSALQTDYFDLYLLHEGVPSFLDKNAFDYLRELKATGRVHKIGLAAGGWHYTSLSPAQIVEWDVLQYEFGPAWLANAALQRQFPDQAHIFHSCLRGVADMTLPGVSKSEIPGRILAECLSLNVAGKVLFSSTNLRHIRDNLRVLTGT